MTSYAIHLYDADQRRTATHSAGDDGGDDAKTAAILGVALGAARAFADVLAEGESAHVVEQGAQGQRWVSAFHRLEDATHEHSANIETQLTEWRTDRAATLAKAEETREKAERAANGERIAKELEDNIAAQRTASAAAKGALNAVASAIAQAERAELALEIERLRKEADARLPRDPE